jgi:hypothetical protein
MSGNVASRVKLVLLLQVRCPGKVGDSSTLQVSDNTLQALSKFCLFCRRLQLMGLSSSILMRAPGTCRHKAKVPAQAPQLGLYGGPSNNVWMPESIFGSLGRHSLDEPTNFRGGPPSRLIACDHRSFPGQFGWVRLIRLAANVANFQSELPLCQVPWLRALATVIKSSNLTPSYSQDAAKNCWRCRSPQRRC